MQVNRTHLIALAVGIVIGCLCGFFTGKAVYQPTYGEKVTRDTVRVTDTVPHYYPHPVEKQVVRYVTRLMPVHSTDTVNRYVTMTDTMLVEVPIESRHYSAKEYDAWVSGYEASLDSIKVYKETQYITETITKTVKDKGKHFFLDVGAGCEYRLNEKTVIPFAELGIKFKTGRFGIGAYGGYSHDTDESKGLPYGKLKISYDIISF